MKVYNAENLFILSNEDFKEKFYQKTIIVKTLDDSEKSGIVEKFIMNAPVPMHEYTPLICGFEIPERVYLNEIQMIKVIDDVN